MPPVGSQRHVTPGYVSLERRYGLEPAYGCPGLSYEEYRDGAVRQHGEADASEQE